MGGVGRVGGGGGSRGGVFLLCESLTKVGYIVTEM